MISFSIFPFFSSSINTIKSMNMNLILKWKIDMQLLKNAYGSIELRIEQFAICMKILLHFSSSFMSQFYFS